MEGRKYGGRVEDALAVRVTLSCAEAEADEYGPRAACEGVKGVSVVSRGGAEGGAELTLEEDCGCDDTSCEAEACLDNPVRDAQVSLNQG